MALSINNTNIDTLTIDGTNITKLTVDGVVVFNPQPVSINSTGVILPTGSNSLSFTCPANKYIVVAVSASDGLPLAPPTCTIGGTIPLVSDSGQKLNGVFYGFTTSTSGTIATTFGYDIQGIWMAFDNASNNFQLSTTTADFDIPSLTSNKNGSMFVGTGNTEVANGDFSSACSLTRKNLLDGGCTYDPNGGGSTPWAMTSKLGYIENLSTGTSSGATSTNLTTGEFYGKRHHGIMIEPA